MNDCHIRQAVKQKAWDSKLKRGRDDMENEAMKERLKSLEATVLRLEKAIEEVTDDLSCLRCFLEDEGICSH